MSLIDIHIQKEDSPTISELSDEITAEPLDEDQIAFRCGEIFISHHKILIFLCSECNSSFYSYSQFHKHLSDQHMTFDVIVKSEIEDIKHELDGNLIESEYNEQEYNLKPELEEEPNQHESYSEGLAMALETIDEYESIDEYDVARSTTYLSESPSPSAHADDNQLLDLELNPEDVLNEYLITKEIGTNGFKCNKCHKYFETEAKLRTHKKHHNKERKHKCNICGFAFTEEFNLRAHLRRHSGDKPHSCELCGKKFTTKNEVKAHVRVHTGERPFICEICGQTFITSGSLNEHKKRHTNFRPHKCKLCEKTFFDSGLLKEHIVKHTGERKHACDECYATFTRRKALLQHKKLHLDVKQYKCNICDKAFAQKPGLASHLKTHRHVVLSGQQESDVVEDTVQFDTNQ